MVFNFFLPKLDISLVRNYNIVLFFKFQISIAFHLHDLNFGLSLLSGFKFSFLSIWMMMLQNKDPLKMIYFI